jgi:hypothetical protein
MVARSTYFARPICHVAEHAPTGNPEPDRQDLERSRERFEALLGR